MCKLHTLQEKAHFPDGNAEDIAPVACTCSTQMVAPKMLLCIALNIRVRKNVSSKLKQGQMCVANEQRSCAMEPLNLHPSPVLCFAVAINTFDLHSMYGHVGNSWRFAQVGGMRVTYISIRITDITTVSTHIRVCVWLPCSSACMFHAPLTMPWFHLVSSITVDEYNNSQYLCCNCYVSAGIEINYAQDSKKARGCQTLIKNGTES